MNYFKSPLLTTAIATLGLTFGAAAFAAEKPTVLLVHGAFAESSSWNGVVAELQEQGYPVIAVGNSLRSVKSDAAFLADVVANTKGPVVLVGHSYGGAVISNQIADQEKIKALVYVAAFAPEQGENIFELSGHYPGSTLGPSLASPVVLKDGNKDLYIQQDKFHAQFAADVPAAEAALMAATQRPVTEAALQEPSELPAWKKIPSWAIYGTADKNIPTAAMKFMAERAGAKKIVEVKDASHVVMTSNPQQVAKLIVEAAEATTE
ncbi:alpha/beta hydrolase [Rheinheimera soli]|uniref:Pimeloyl-ACP methyl ester carboxylesterase n=1 Tax=Rheinheimera soli TaxID=443616 RepID=A0ABU1W0E3_9GAMM|nr:alpha/beta hydrolase [Rheinheimera soli]MDR7121320.1 pimeloyl-ACP methyl ester carboxylesterase [Rheinheimera soli]